MLLHRSISLVAVSRSLGETARVWRGLPAPSTIPSRSFSRSTRWLGKCTHLSIPSPPSTHPTSSAKVGDRSYPRDQWTNVTPTILDRTTAQLHRQPGHPLHILAQRVRATFSDFAFHDYLNPDVTVEANFDQLGFPPDHPGRSRGDTYYLNEQNVLRTHTSAHQTDLMRVGERKFLVAADVYRRDEIDSSHYPVFHQIEGLKLFDVSSLGPEGLGDGAGVGRTADTGPVHVVDDSGPTSANPVQEVHSRNNSLYLTEDLKKELERLVLELFRGAPSKESGAPLKIRWVEAYFPFTSPSWELEVEWEGQWLELLGCGVIQQPLIRAAGLGENRIGWAFGLGLERLAMVLFGIPDIRLFWSKDPRFLSQFTEGEITRFKPFSRHPPCTKDVSFWLSPEQECGVAANWSDNDLMEVIREVAGDMVEDVKMVDSFIHPKTHRKSMCYRITYRSMDRNVTNEEINTTQEEVRRRLVSQLRVELR
ncbi:hypothetical protein BJ684DRAFT_23191 [Piptocephalis cylindrospora]|uniref:Phenylalanine--tRNA ligase, mitochondrial n=1 Tax=Piptocephalis cylindrospora TaxID=1907219 RepID=A0A4P9Y050_9FUNG|nr:hypothetical protein BJ684DRAFT_23191 [Piptocephalis cylindrospora]|eukprot:RKP11812.1 hypothetical protein BJ684DRAFT_23191 [Piptocephalis cylindrospora]